MLECPFALVGAERVVSPDVYPAEQENDEGALEKECCVGVMACRISRCLVTLKDVYA